MHTWNALYTCNHIEIHLQWVSLCYQLSFGFSIFFYSFCGRHRIWLDDFQSLQKHLGVQIFTNQKLFNSSLPLSSPVNGSFWWKTMEAFLPHPFLFQDWLWASPTHGWYVFQVYPIISGMLVQIYPSSFWVLIRILHLRLFWGVVTGGVKGGDVEFYRRFMGFSYCFIHWLMILMDQTW